MILVWIWLRSSLEGLAAKIKRTSEPPHWRREKTNPREAVKLEMTCPGAAPSPHTLQAISASFFTRGTSVSRTARKQGRRHVQESVLAGRPGRAGDRRIARHWQDDCGRLPQPRRRQGLHHCTQGWPLRRDRRRIERRIWRRMYRAAYRHLQSRRRRPVGSGNTGA